MVANDQRRLRTAVETEIERLISLLDTMDGDPDIEANGDEEDGHADDLEPSLGGGGYWTDAGQMYDLEQDTSDDEPNGDELDYNGDEGDYDGGEGDAPGFIPGGQGL
ncbi:MAG: hypothetical protein KL801_09395 [Mesorhizobium sp.]|nr:hypothetical protein [Mesorhizobium sp.]